MCQLDEHLLPWQDRWYIVAVSCIPQHRVEALDVFNPLQVGWLCAGDPFLPHLFRGDVTDLGDDLVRCRVALRFRFHHQLLDGQECCFRIHR